MSLILHLGGDTEVGPQKNSFQVKNIQQKP